MTCRRPYDTDLTDPEWEHLKLLVPLAKPGGRPHKHSRREILNGIFYTVRSGCAWKLLPHDLPPWRTVYHYFWSWRRNGTWQKIHDSIRGSVREAAGRHPEPSGAVVDSQSVQSTEQGGVRGFDAAKNVSGRKRHVLVDTLGLVLLVVVTAANAQDRAAARLLLTTLATRFRRYVWCGLMEPMQEEFWTNGFADSAVGARSGWRSFGSQKDSLALQFCRGAGL